ncbi:MCE family protein [Mycolicibacterium monacense]|uniref:Mammalian cell entry protein n=2 Tax=Mycobacteriaceae TaxID=1762 RepID=A0AAD1IRF9_MYCMB|nr:MlaD family protein [Mycolicibacterium monacense]MDA4104795.1 mammalian cell entry protein [Mycolicibacterium monacense DSM 44395]ORB22810.1 MCE family protein [Mycolicibacterium monacense DSM 44395]QHP87695.1 MCE family protein [Mycolicibacterium monacense DSM 44395]BBZ59133.1 mammalian cell entry protein [Mycolicibacterium monacense]
MHITRRIWIQLGVFLAVALTAFSIMAFNYMKLPNLLFGIGRYSVTLQLPEAGGLYERGNVTYRGTEVGQVKSVRLTESGDVEAELSLQSDVKIPANLIAEVHSQSAVGEQYVALLPQGDGGPVLKNGDVISQERTTVPPDINSLLDATNRGLEAIPGDNLKTAVDEAYTAVGGLGPEINRFVKGSTALAIDARKNLDDLTNVVDNVAPILDTQTDTSDSIQAWASHLAGVTKQLQSNDAAVQGILHNGPGAADEARALFDRLQPTLPIVLANLVSIEPVLVTYRDNLEQLLVLLPQATSIMQAIGVPNRHTKMDFEGAFLAFNLNVNIPPPCTTGFLPVQQMRPAAELDSPERPAEDLYCRIPQDSMFNVRGARNTPCVTRPGKRAPTVKMCESDEEYVPLNDGHNWKGDPNATTSGQDIPQPPAGSLPNTPAPTLAPAPPIAAADYDPATGTYVGPDGHVYTQSNLARSANEEQTWQQMLIPPTGQ